jgi:NADH-quinone oxidoreductase subunit E
MFTLEDVECIAACTEAPCLQVNYRYFHRVSTEDLDR